MANIIINIAAKIFLNFSPMTVALIRDIDNTKPVTLNYTSGTGQTMTAGQVLYTVGTAGQSGFLQVTVATTTTLVGAGTVSLTVTSHPSPTQANQSVPFTFDQSTITLNITYNSKPVTSNVTISMANRAIRPFTTAEFLAAYTDFDSDAMIEMMATGTMTGYEYDVNGTNNWIAYVAGTWIPVNNIARLRYVAADQDTAYTKTNAWFAKDAQGNISV
jgi:hypothetical protein